MDHNQADTGQTLREWNFKSFGVDSLCYVKCVPWSGGRLYAVHGASACPQKWYFCESLFGVPVRLADGLTP